MSQEGVTGVGMCKVVSQMRRKDGMCLNCNMLSGNASSETSGHLLALVNSRISMSVGSLGG